MSMFLLTLESVLGDFETKCFLLGKDGGQNR
jgi:hypothetical protein